MDQEQSQPRRSLREIAIERGLIKRDAEHTPLAQRDLKGEDRRLDLDDPFAVSSVEPPRFKTTSQAVEHLRAERQQADEAAAEEAKKGAAENEKWFNDTVSRESTWSSDEEAQALRSYQERMTKFQQGAQAWEASKEHIASHVRDLNSNGRHVEAQQIAQRFLGLRDALQAEHNELVALTHRGIQHHKAKQVRANQLRLARANPKFLNEGYRRRYVSWLEGEGGLREAITGEEDPRVHSFLSVQFDRVEKERDDAINRKKVASTAVVRRGPGSAASSAEALEQLRKHGKPDDALRFMHARRLERSYGL